MRALIDPRVDCMSLLITDVTVGDRPGRAVHVVDGRIAWLGDAADAPAADRVIAGEGALLTPAFVDAHVHATATGLALTGLDLHSSLSLADAVARRRPLAQRPAGIVLGTGWDETGWPERRGPHPRRPRRRRRRPAGLPGPGRRPLGHRLHRPARPHPRHRRPARASRPTASCGSTPTTPPVGPPTARSAPTSGAPPQRATLDAAAALGIGSVHEMAGPEVSGADDLAGLLELAAEQPGPLVLGYWGELAERGGLDVVRELGLAGAGGDLFCDGALGSHTAALGSGPYADRPDTAGTLRFATGAARRTTSAPARPPGSRPASTSSATPRSPR